ncbi:YtxH domain-containing protein [Pisciglobus halotolerans]|uniref:Gas vesicle protein n=1 Tax=Pisciglobus halotolerans TaxID=745365 RepID=A0A1I3CAG0_9LACT|nr:YtxH domain-containing protein [Pisciglobus halotolerans]SFH71423.1 Gas vesicle protein [Pisciglobus halotolerans]
MKLTFLKGLFVGSLVGGTIGLLKTPRSGKQNREAFKDYIDETTILVEDVSNKVNDLKGAITQLSNESQSFATTFTKEMNETAQAFTYEAEPRLRRIQEQTEKLTTDINDLNQAVSSDA